MKSKSFLCTAALVLGAAPLLAQAALIDITVTGTIYGSYDETGNVFGQGSGSGIVNGQTAVLKFTYDTANAPGDYYGGADPNYAIYFGRTDWIESSATIDGNTVLDLAGENGITRYEEILLFNSSLLNGYFDEIQVNDGYYKYTFGYDSNDHFFSHSLSSANEFYLDSYVENFLKDLSLNQTFSLVADGSNSYGYGTINRYRYDYECLDTHCIIENYERGSAGFTVNTITMSPRNAAIPEPGSLALIGLGIAGLALVRRRKAVAC